jgi:hypothetical protein
MGRDWRPLRSEVVTTMEYQMAWLCWSTHEDGGYVCTLHLPGVCGVLVSSTAKAFTTMSGLAKSVATLLLVYK